MKKLEKHIKKISFAISAEGIPVRLRAEVLRRAGLSLGSGVAVGSRVRFNGNDVSVGDGSYINSGCYFDAGPIRVGNDVFIGPNVVLASGTHELGPSSRRAGKNIWETIVVEDGCWIGANATILGNVTVASGCVIAAGAVVVKSTEANGLYAGVPARRIKDLS